MIEQRSISQLLDEASAELAEAGIDDGKLDARLLLQAAGNFSRTDIATNPSDLVNVDVVAKFENFIGHRKSGKPVFRIIGRREFYGREFQVFDNVLDPRPETELLVERVLDDWSGKSPNFVEIGVGSGAISVSLLVEMANAHGTATDISTDALKAASANANSLGVDSRLHLIETDCLNGIAGKFDFIVSNPPYISSEEMKHLPIEVRDHDPRISLEAGENGLAFYRKIFEAAKVFLNDDGMLYLETGRGQHDALIKMAHEKGWGLVSKHLDLSGLERIVVFRV